MAATDKTTIGSGFDELAERPGPQVLESFERVRKRVAAAHEPSALSPPSAASRRLSAATRRATEQLFGGISPPFLARQGEFIEATRPLVAEAYLGMLNRAYPIPRALDVSGDLAPAPRPPGWEGTLFRVAMHPWSTVHEVVAAVDNGHTCFHGHLHYEGDELLSGSVGVVEEWMLPPGRIPAKPSPSSWIDTLLRTQGWLAGWTGLYDSILAADDKWSKCSFTTSDIAFLPDGTVLDSHRRSLLYVDLANESPIGQVQINMFSGYGGILRLETDLASLKAAKIPILLHLETRFDFQLEGDADLWFYRNVPANPGPGNALCCHHALPELRS